LNPKGENTVRKGEVSRNSRKNPLEPTRIGPINPVPRPINPPGVTFETPGKTLVGFKTLKKGEESFPSPKEIRDPYLKKALQRPN